MFYYALVSSDLEIQELQMSREVSRINNGITNMILDEIEKSSLIIPNFILSITPLTSPAPQLHTTIDPVNPQTYTARMTLSTRIFMIWEYVLISKQLTKNDEASYITDFLQRANSKQLYELWKVSKINYNDTTQIYGDLLFEYGLKISEQQPEHYSLSAKQLLDDNRYQQLFA